MASPVQVPRAARVTNGARPDFGGTIKFEETKGAAPRDLYSRDGSSSLPNRVGQFVARRAMRRWARWIQLRSVTRSSLGAAIPVRLDCKRPICTSS